jgi:hypothetical protein
MLGGLCLKSFSFDDLANCPTGALFAVDGSSEEGWEWLRRVNKVRDPRLFELLRGGVGGMDRLEAADDLLGGC